MKFVIFIWKELNRPFLDHEIQKPFGRMAEISVLKSSCVRVSVSVRSEREKKTNKNT